MLIVSRGMHVQKNIRRLLDCTVAEQAVHHAITTLVMVLKRAIILSSTPVVPMDIGTAPF